MNLEQRRPSDDSDDHQDDLSHHTASDPAVSDQIESDPELQFLVDQLDRLWQTPPPAAIYSLVGTNIGHFKIDRQVGIGAFGVVYKAWDERNRRDVALKVPRPEILHQRQKLERFIKESAAIAQLQHPGIVALYRADLTAEIPYIAVAYCDGLDLDEWLQRNPLPSPRVAASFVKKLVEAVQHAHTQGIIHRDIKPSNVLLSWNARVELDEPECLRLYEPKLTDFGLARITLDDLEDTRSSVIIGTPLYMAPEQAAGEHENIGPGTDIFALGALLYRLLVGEPPFFAESYPKVLRRLESGDVHEPHVARSDIPVSLSVICLKCLETNPENRYASAAELSADLERFLQDKPVAARRPSLARRFARWIHHDERSKEACSLIQGISIARASFALVGLVCLLLLADTSVTAGELWEAALSHTFITMPTEIWILWTAHRLRRGTLSKSGYWGGFLFLVAWFVLASLATLGVFVPSRFYQRADVARIVAFSMVAVLFAIQAAAWMVAGKGTAVRAARSRGWLAAHTLVLAAAIAAIVGACVVRATPSHIVQAARSGPDRFITLDGSDDYVSVPTLVFDAKRPVTIELWFRPQEPQTACLVSHGPLSLFCGVANEAVNPRIHVMLDQERMLLIYADTLCPCHEWSHIACTYDGQQINLYVNGMPATLDWMEYRSDAEGMKRIDNIPAPLVVADVYPGASTYVGANQPPGGPNPYPFCGDIAEFRVQDRIFYRGPFLPRTRLSPSGSTRVLLHMDDLAEPHAQDVTNQHQADLHRRAIAP